MRYLRYSWIWILFLEGWTDTAIGQDSIQPLRINLPEMVLVEGGVFRMGCPLAGSDELPVHEVSLGSMKISEASGRKYRSPTATAAILHSDRVS